MAEEPMQRRRAPAERLLWPGRASPSASSGRPSISPNGRGGWTPLRPLRGFQETRVATREESGVLGFPSRRGLTPRVSERTTQPLLITWITDRPLMLSLPVPRSGPALGPAPVGPARAWACRAARCSPRGNPACRGAFGGRSKAVRDRLALQTGLPWWSSG